MTAVPFEPGHAEAVAALCAAEGYASYADPAVARHVLAAPGVTSLVAVEGDVIVGVLQLQSDGAVQAHLSLLLVSPQARGRGIGRLLVEEGFRRAGGKRIDLLAEDAAVGFYRSFAHKEKLGFRIYPGMVA